MQDACPDTGLRILGIDPGLNITGYGVLEVAKGKGDRPHLPERPEGGHRCAASVAAHMGTAPFSSRLRLCEAGIVRGKTRGSLTQRLLEIHQGVADVIAAFGPSVMALEQLYSHYQRPRTAILMGHARGAICLAAAQAGIPVVHYSATQVKRILTGAGRAGKAQVQRAIQRELALPKLPEPPDVADALAIALCHYYLCERRKP